ncbi:hypothetical protein MRBBS_1625 [Marinobacter sp. BSs20148]|nr:hypothetical protein MRBBS_1625 [Marinobacter sp. BSs20148]
MLAPSFRLELYNLGMMKGTKVDKNNTKTARHQTKEPQ